MQVLIGSDAFKDAADAPTVCEAIGMGIRRVLPDVQLDTCPLADGGEGTARILTQQLGARWIPVPCYDPLGRPVMAGYGWLEHTRTAFLDMAEASGLQHLSARERNPMATSSFGTGQLLRSALDRAPRRIYLGIGGSATNDGGIGMAAALGYRFFNGSQLIEVPAGQHLTQFTRIERSGRHPFLAKAEILTLCDVRNPLLGEQGASRVYGPQKGATAANIKELERGLERLNDWWAMHFGGALAHLEGSGAAGGLGAALIAFCGSSLVSGADTIFDLLQIRNRVEGKDLVISGEGRLDQQSFSGKLTGQLARVTQAMQVPLVVLCGQLDLTPSELSEKGIHAAYAITPDGTPLPRALCDTPVNLAHAASMVARTFST